METKKSLKKTFKKIPKRSRQLITSWVLYSLRATLEEEKIRNNIIKYKLEEIAKNYGYKIVYSATLNNLQNNNEIYQYLNSLFSTYPSTINEKIIIVFTLSNLPDLSTGETHFQTCIYIPKFEAIFTFDPARNKCGSGIYKPFAIKSMEKWLKSSMAGAGADNIKIIWPEITNPCQTHSNDVFCQSWSLYLQIEWINSFFNRLTELYNNRAQLIDDLKSSLAENTPFLPDLTKKILDVDHSAAIPTSCAVIPSGQIDRYKLLINFYKSIISAPNVCKKLSTNYKKFINHDFCKTTKKDCNVVNLGFPNPCLEILSYICTNISDCDFCGPPELSDRKKTFCPEIAYEPQKIKK